MIFCFGRSFDYRGDWQNVVIAEHTFCVLHKTFAERCLFESYVITSFIIVFLCFCFFLLLHFLSYLQHLWLFLSHLQINHLTNFIIIIHLQEYLTMKVLFEQLLGSRSLLLILQQHTSDRPLNPLTQSRRICWFCLHNELP